MTGLAERIAEFASDEEAPEGALAKILCRDHVGTYTLPFPCRRSEGTWFNERTGEPLDAEVVGWREWDATVTSGDRLRQR
jgi:hypothetical protein